MHLSAALRGDYQVGGGAANTRRSGRTGALRLCDHLLQRRRRIHRAVR